MITEKFIEQVKRTPNQVALNTGTRSLTYAELNQCANRVAQQVLQAVGQPGPNNRLNLKYYFPKRVSLYIEHGPDMIIAILGVLKAGCAYVPLSIDYPPDRLTYMIENSGSGLILTKEQYAGRVQAFLRSGDAAANQGDVSILCIDQPGEHLPTGDPGIPVEPGQIAYIMYTSGSTGRPKGVMQTHENVLYYTRNWVRLFSITDTDRLTLFSSFCHDGSVQDMFSALLSGATLYPVDVRNQQEHFDLSTFLREEKITIWHSVHSLFTYFSSSLKVGKNFEELRYILLGGEPVRRYEIDMFKKFFPHSLLANVYGQTESSVDTVRVFHHDETIDYLTIGEPLDQTQVLLLDKDYSEVDEFEVGEIIIASPHLSPGYWKDETSTAKAFKTADETGRLYFTGDLGRLLPGGEIEFMGRRDYQLKIRGFRIEPGEIESVLLSHPSISQVVVLAKEISAAIAPTTGEKNNDSSEKYLCAYIVANHEKHDDDETGLATQLREFAAQKVPDYMVPTYFIFLNQFPLTQSGKIDRRALPEPFTNRTGQYIAPRNQLEERLAQVWQEVLTKKEQPVGIDDNFFELGGHSLRATTMLSKIQREYQVHIPVAQIFQTSTIRGLARLIEESKKEQFQPLEPAEKKEYYPLTSMQQRLYILHSMEGVDTAYNMRSAFIIEGALDIERLQDVFKTLIQRHESLRTSFRLVNDEPVQIIHHPDEIHFSIDDDERERSDSLSPTDADSLLPGGAGTGTYPPPLDISCAPLMRVGLATLAEGRYLLLIDAHHIVFDGTSRMILLRELFSLYSGRDLPPLQLQYKDYAEWMNREQQQVDNRERENYWLQQFSGELELPVLDLPMDFPRPTAQSFAGQAIIFELSQEQTRKLKELALTQGVTMYMVLLSIFDILLAKLSGLEDIIIGTPVAGRMHPDIQETIGVFVNTLAMRCFPVGEKPFLGFLEEVKEVTLGAYAHQEYRFEALLEKINVQRDAGRNPLFDVMFAFQNVEAIPLEITGLKISPYRYQRQTTIFDLNLQAYEDGAQVKFNLDYSTRLFKKETVERWMRYYQNIISSLLTSTGKKIADIEMIPASEKQRILYDFNDTAGDYPVEQTILQVFAGQVEKTPQAVALESKTEGSLTYGEFNKQVESLAQQLAQYSRTGKSGNGIVAIMLQPSFALLTGIYAIMAAGAAYLPVNPDQPASRTGYMLRDSSVSLLLTSKNLMPEVEACNIPGTETLYLHLTKGQSNDSYRDEPGATGTLKEHNRPRHSSKFIIHNSRTPLAYVIYTSGSTGLPKGVMVEQRSLMNILYAMQAAFPISTRDRYLLKTSFIFDVSVAELFGWVFGGRLVVMDAEERKDPRQIIETIHRSAVTHINFVPSLFAVFLDLLQHENIQRIVSLKHIFLAGEALSSHLVKQARSLGLKAKLENIYGPTESTIYASAYSLTDWGGDGDIPIGKPLANIQLFILDCYGNLQPSGVPGELCIVGSGLARGYLNNPELTAEKFIRIDIIHSSYRSYKSYMSYAPQALRGCPRRWLYKSGDLCSWLPDGNIAFFGRLDHQVKVRGFRIELGEIEQQLLQHPAVAEVVVVAGTDEQGDTSLCGYVVPNHGAGETMDAQEPGIDAEKLVEFLKKNLPAYMIPASFVFLEKIPLTPSGKIDRRVLPHPAKTSHHRYVAPRNRLEQRLVEVWAEVLNIEAGQIGIDDDFFALGGHSLKGTVIAAKIQRELSIKISLADIFRSPTPRKLAATITTAVVEDSNVIEAVEEKEYYPLSANQERLWFIHQQYPDSPAYNLPGILYFHEEVDVQVVVSALTAIFERQDSLRTGFFLQADEPMQFILPHVETLPFQEIDLSYLDENRKEERFKQVLKEVSNQVFNLSTPPLFHSLLVKLEQDEYRFVFNMHHIISDGWSMEVLKKELLYFYRYFQQPGALSTGKTLDPPFPPLTLQYKDFAVWNKNLLTAADQGNNEAHQFWKNKVAAGVLQLILPRSLGANSQDVQGALYRVWVPAGLHRDLEKLSESHRTSLFMVLFSVYLITLARYSGQKQVSCSIISAGREQEALFPVIGFFVHSLLFITELDEVEGFDHFLKKVETSALDCLKYQNYPLEKVFQELKTRYPDIPVAFNMINFHSSTPGNCEADQKEKGDEIEPFDAYHIDDFRDVKFDLEPYIHQYQNGIDIHWAYRRAMFSREAVESFVQDYLKLLGFFSKEPQASYKDFKASARKRKFKRKK